MTADDSIYRFHKKQAETTPPLTEEALCDEIKANRPGAAEQWKILMKAAFKMKQ